MGELDVRFPKWAIALIAIGAFLIVDQGRDYLYDLAALSWDRTLLNRFIYFWSWLIVLPLLAAVIVFGSGRAFSALGLTGNPLIGAAVGVTATMPMLVGFSVFGTVGADTDFVTVAVGGAVYPGIGEEVLYRGLLFGFLFRFAGWGFVPAALMGAAVFGAAHLWQGESVGEAAAIMALTAIGGAWFAWLYVEWKNNLWVPIAFHLLMNLYWGIFDIADNALGGGLGNATRVATIVLSVLITYIFMVRQNNGSVLAGRLWTSR